MKTSAEIRTELAASLTPRDATADRAITLTPLGSRPIRVQFTGPYVTINVGGDSSALNRNEALDLAAAITYAAQFIG